MSSAEMEAIPMGRARGFAVAKEGGNGGAHTFLAVGCSLSMLVGMAILGVTQTGLNRSRSHCRIMIIMIYKSLHGSGGHDSDVLLFSLKLSLSLSPSNPSV